MLKRGASRLISQTRGLMTLSKLYYFHCGTCYAYGLRGTGGWSRIQNISFAERHDDSAPSSCSSLRLSGSLNPNGGLFRKRDDGVVMAHAIAPLHQMVPDSKDLRKVIGTNLVNGFGKPLRSLGEKKHEIMNVAVDVDEVLGSFVSALNRFIADHYSSNHTVSDYYVYEFFRIWNCTQAEAEIRVHEFFKTTYFRSGIDPIPGAHTVLCNIAKLCNLSVVTSRQNVIKDHTCEWIEKHYPGLFKSIHFGNHYALDGRSRPKSEICRSIGAQVLIDDNPRYALECAEAGIRVLLFDYDNSYPWCKDSSVDSHSLVTRVHSWQEVEQHIVSWSVLQE
ncbi:hypothetical protein AXF42_Ash006073 [Apostasia shenzhenica]|uniref:Uncharacterized protein n=1 Tax=Apostasia shenzhenica TaxID=1088818 RepID=A0A2I0B060_9ASPA|nr:hypothetical protein AXF42_Ash006073 [Apostasia shenzhenica]